MDLKITAPSIICGDINLPYSKSITNRVLLINKLAGGGVRPQNVAVCDDSEMMMRALSPEQVVDTGAAGTATRFATAYLSMQDGEYLLTGSQRMKKRPISILVSALRELGADIEYVENEGYLPLKIRGKELRGGAIELSGGVSSQYISALLMIAPYMKEGLKITLTGEIISFPYIKMTISLMAKYGVYAEINGNTITVPRGKYNSIPYKIESDWSAASYWYGFAALADYSDLVLEGLEDVSIQGDSKAASLFTPLGVSTEYNDGYIKLHKSDFIRKIYEADLTETPDLAQAIVVTAALKNIPFKLTGLKSLRIKETDRISALVTEMKKLGYDLDDSQEGTLVWDGTKSAPIENIEINTYDDHRMAMSFAIASYIFPKIKILDSEVVSKSYPGFWNDLTKAGFTIEQ